MSTVRSTAIAPSDTNASATQGEVSALDKVLDKQIEYKPFLSEQLIQLTPRMVIRFMCKPTKSGKRATLEQALHFCMLCKARGLNPWEGDAYIVGYDAADGPEFSLITAHQAFLKRAEVHPEYDGMKSGVIVKRGDDIVEEEGDFYLEGDTVLGGWARVFFKTRATPVYKRLRLSVFNKGFSRWKVDPAGMIVKCAEADALRTAFPNSLGGMYLEDEMPGKPSGDDLSAANGVIDVAAFELKEKTQAKTAALRDRLNQTGSDGGRAVTGADTAEIVLDEQPIESAEQKKARENNEKKALRKAIKERFTEEQIEKATGGRDINALGLDELVELKETLSGER